MVLPVWRNRRSGIVSRSKGDNLRGPEVEGKVQAEMRKVTKRVVRQNYFRGIGDTYFFF